MIIDALKIVFIALFPVILILGIIVLIQGIRSRRKKKEKQVKKEAPKPMEPKPAEPSTPAPTSPVQPIEVEPIPVSQAAKPEPREKKPEKKARLQLIRYIKYPAVKDVYVFEKHADLIIPIKAKYDMSTQTLVTSDNKTYVVPEDYRPLLFYRKRFFRRQAVLVFLADPAKGVLLRWDTDGINVASVNPKFIGTVLNSKLLEKLAGAVFVRITDIISWLLAGLGIAFILIFVVFPLLGIHVQIGSQPIIVQPKVNIQQPQAPPPGNFTIR